MQDTVCKHHYYYMLEWPMISSLYVASSLSVLVMAVYQSDGLEIEAIFQSLGWQRGEQAVARVVVVLDDLSGLPVTSGAVGVLEGRQFAPGDALCRPHHPLESLVVEGGAVALDCASVKVCQGFG